MDYYIYSGEIAREHVLPVLTEVKEKQSSEHATLFLTTNGGDPDAAYKIGRYLQRRYDHLTVCISGTCKSAGTLLAIAADDLAFAPYGELGPLDIQLSKRDDIMRLESGLNISEAFASIGENARFIYGDLIMDIIRNSGGAVSFQTATSAAAEVIAGLYGPVFAQIEPDEVGSRQRAMRIGYEYAKRLNSKPKNISELGAVALCQNFPSHSFVIDQAEAAEMFFNVRDVNKIEAHVIQKLGQVARHESRALEFGQLNTIIDDINVEEHEERTDAESQPNTADGTHADSAGLRPSKTTPRKKRKGNADDSSLDNDNKTSS